MRGAVIYGPGDIRVEQRPDPVITAPTDAIIRLAATCVCGSDLWSWRGTATTAAATATLHSLAAIPHEWRHPAELSEIPTPWSQRKDKAKVGL